MTNLFRITGRDLWDSLIFFRMQDISFYDGTLKEKCWALNAAMSEVKATSDREQRIAEAGLSGIFGENDELKIQRRIVKAEFFGEKDALTAKRLIENALSISARVIAVRHVRSVSVTVGTPVFALLDTNGELPFSIGWVSRSVIESYRHPRYSGRNWYSKEHVRFKERYERFQLVSIELVRIRRR